MLERSSAEKRRVPPAFSVTLQETIMEVAPGSSAVRSMSQRLKGQLSAKLEMVQTSTARMRGTILVLEHYVTL